MRACNVTTVSRCFGKFRCSAGCAHALMQATTLLTVLRRLKSARLPIGPWLHHSTVGWSAYTYHLTCFELGAL